MLTPAGAMAEWDFCGRSRLSILSLRRRLRASSRARELAADSGTAQTDNIHHKTFFSAISVEHILFSALALAAASASDFLLSTSSGS